MKSGICRISFILQYNKMNICVFCSSSNAIDEVYFEEAKTVGKIIAENGHILINGGANVGLMETVTKSAKENEGKTIGIIPEMLKSRSLVSDHAHQVIVTNDMMERKAKMREMSDAFIALPGGFGTLEEILEVITLRQLSYHIKPIVFINTNNFFDSLFNQFELAYSENFSKEIYREMYFVTKNAKKAINYIENYQPHIMDSKWYEVPEKKKNN